MMKRKPSNIIRTVALTLLLASPALAMAEVESCVVVVENDGSTYKVAMAAMDRIAFAGDGFTISDLGQNRKWFDYSQVDRILFNAEFDAVSAVAADGRLAVWPSPAADFVNVAGLPDGAEAAAYTLSGAKVASALSTDGSARLDISAAPAGTLLITADGRSVKIIKN